MQCCRAKLKVKPLLAVLATGLPGGKPIAKGHYLSVVSLSCSLLLCTQFSAEGYVRGPCHTHRGIKKGGQIDN